MTALAACIFSEFTFGIALLVPHNGDIEHLASAALRGCNKRSGDKALRNSGELGSALFGRTNDFLPPEIVWMLLALDVMFVDVEFGVFDPLLVSELFKLVLFGNAQPGLYDCVVFDAPDGKKQFVFKDLFTHFWKVTIEAMANCRVWSNFQHQNSVKLTWLMHNDRECQR